jgi:UDP-N-acetyl-2-amino-2-deoxyglucuronate dehydrogenase
MHRASRHHQIKISIAQAGFNDIPENPDRIDMTDLPKAVPGHPAGPSGGLSASRMAKAQCRSQTTGRRQIVKDGTGTLCRGRVNFPLNFPLLRLCCAEMERPLRVGIIGCGVIAPSHIDSYRGAGGAEVVALCDLLPERMEAVARRYPQAVFRQYREAAALLADPGIDAVSICTDHASHEALFRDAVAAGKHAICEKALTINEESLLRMESLAGSARVVTAGIFQHRFDPVYRVVKALLEENALGRLLTVSGWHQCLRTDEYYRQDGWRGNWAGEGGSLLINQSIHFLDILQWIAGGVASVSAEFANLAHQGIIETEDTASVALRFRCGALGTFVATSSSNREWEWGYRIAGTDGDIQLRNGQLERCTHRDAGRAAALEKRLQQLDEGPGVAGAKAYYGTGHPAQIRDFVDAIRNGRKPFVGIAEAAEALRLVLAIYQAGRTGRRVAIQ